MIATFKVQDPIEQPESNNPAYALKSDDGKNQKTSSFWRTKNQILQPEAVQYGGREKNQTKTRSEEKPTLIIYPKASLKRCED